LSDLPHRLHCEDAVRRPCEPFTHGQHCLAGFARAHANEMAGRIGQIVIAEAHQPSAAELQAQGMPAAELELVKKRYASGHYKAPDRGGASYMLSPILRTYIDPEVSGAVETSTNPHIMHYAPNVSNKALGGVKPSINPLTFIIQEGPHGFAVQHLGEKEMAAIKIRYAPMLDRLCGLNALWCLPKQ
jgi:hypothetical protein